jgi:hypothetical protein
VYDTILNAKDNAAKYCAGDDRGLLSATLRIDFITVSKLNFCKLAANSNTSLSFEVTGAF